MENFFNLKFPIVQAPMAGSTTADLVAAVCNAGGMGSLGVAYMSPEKIKEEIAQVRGLTDKAFNVNLFAIESPEMQGDPAPAIGVLESFHLELGLAKPEVPGLGASFEEQARAVLEAGVAVFSFTFGVPGADLLRAFRDRGTKIVGTATTTREAEILEAAGVDAVVAQGSEAGAHRGTFEGTFEQSMVSTMALVPQMAKRVKIPVIASGGIMDGRGIRAAMELGASAVQMGTAFLVCPESGAPECYKQAVLSAGDDSTKLTRAFSGRPARGIRNRFMLAAEAAGPEAILNFPHQNNLTRPMRNAAAKAGNPEMLSLWAGQAAGLARRMPAGELVRTLAREAGWLASAAN